ncbi:hypothetical protein Tco_1317819 [Tanacetum coccineum]
MSTVLQERGFRSLPSSTETNPRGHVKSISTTVEANMTPIRHIRLSQYVRKCHASHTKLTVELVDRTVKYSKGIAENVLVGIGLRERVEPELESRLIGETLVLNRSLDHLYGDYIELNDLNVQLKLRRDQVDDLMPTIEEGEVINEPMIDIIKTRNNESFDEYPSFCDIDQNINIDCAYNLRFSCMIGFEHVNANFFLPFSINVMSREFYNSIMKDKFEYKGKNVVGAFMNIPIFVRNFSVVSYFVVVENMDGYQDQDMGDVIVGEPFCKASCVCSKKVSVHDKLNGISHPYQKLKSFYKGVLNLGHEYIQDAKIEEWLTRGHISVPEMK